MSPQSFIAMKNTIYEFAKSNPLYAILIAIAIIAFLYFGISGIWSSAKVSYLEHQNRGLENERQTVIQQRDVLQVKADKQEGQLAEKDKELEKKDALLQAAAKQVVQNKKSLDDTLATAGRIMDDTSVLTKDQLRDELCGLYNIPPAACK